MTNNEKIPAQGGEMPPVERAAITGSGGIDTVRGAMPAGNAAQERNTNAAALDRDIAHLIDCSEGGIARVPRETLVRLRALLTAPRARLPRHVLASLECTAVWLEKGNDPHDAARELRACLAKIDAPVAAPVAETFARLPLSAEQRSALVWAIGRTRAQDELALADVLLDILNLSPVEVHPIGSVRVDLIRSANVSEVSEPVLTLSSDFEAAIDMSPGTEFHLYASPIEFHESRAVASPATASGLPAWFDTFLTNVCEIPDRNSPVGEPDAIIATLDELKNCALNAIEKCVPAPATADEYAAFAWPPLPAFPESFAHVAGHAYFTEHQMQGYANAYGEAIRTAQAATPHSARVAALEAENRELAEFVVAVGGFWGESRSKLIGPLSLAEVIKQAMREQVSAPSDHSLREPKFAVSRAEVREHSTMRTLTAKRNTYHGGEMWKPPRGNLPSFLLDQLHGRDDPKVTAANNRSYAAGVRDGRVLGAAAVGGTDHVQRELRNDVLFGNHDALDAGANALDRLGADSEAAGVRAVAHELRKVEARAVRHSDGIELPDGEGSEI
ncbi:hypothetical protein [Burkholderia gladioli]|uniref:hypothetical protein n=1 Tax=Burkholderia gladioli TaxID=28095 RepID=UPI00265489FD|nr:hypothetical protein [Burkholderia gladioli]MDN7803151.1 hypothetical protein [Burkholderia gladioli]